MAGEFTISQINTLGERLRKGEHTTQDLERLDSYRRSFDGVYATVTSTVRRLGLEASGRIKTTVSIIEKLKRQSFRLSKLQDIAGCRLVVDDVLEQDRVVGLIVGAFAKSKIIDRRRADSHGYRAVHIVVEVDGTLLEIQVRTELQHLWAVWSEALADQYDQSLKYGSGPVEIQEIMTLQSEVFRLLEEREEIIAKGLAITHDNETRVSLRDLGSDKPLPLEVLEGMRWVGDFKKLVKDKEERRDAIAREILNLKREKKEP